jgi:hypothetical protein
VNLETPNLPKCLRPPIEAGGPKSLFYVSWGDDDAARSLAREPCDGMIWLVKGMCGLVLPAPAPMNGLVGTGVGEARVSPI